MGAELVLIPFIAGQWSLRLRFPLPGHAELASLNPLHCGAVVASEKLSEDLRGDIQVLIPFIAGQWSLLPDEDLIRRIAAES